MAIVTLGQEGEFDECPIGILDTTGETGRKWLVSPWLPSPRNVRDAARVMGRRAATVKQEKAHPAGLDVKEQMIWRDDHGLDGSYEATVDAMLDGADMARKAAKEGL